MATITKWTPFEVALDVTATGGTVVRKSATQFTVVINASWETYYSGAKTNYGMTASSGGGSVNLNSFGTASAGGSGSFTGTYSISGNGSATKSISVVFRNFNTDNGNSATKTVTFSVTVPAWTSYKITYNANGGSGAPGSQTKWKDQALTLSSTKPTRTGYSFLGWSTSSSATSATYSAGGSYTANSAATLYAVWKANTYTVKYNANGGTGVPANQTKTYGQTLILSSTKPTRTNYNFKGWATSATATSAAYSAGGSYTKNAAITLYAVWELAYVKPRITNVVVVRCTSDGTHVEDGTNAIVSFNWKCDLDVSSIVIKWKLSDASSWTSITVSASGTSGTVNQIIGSDDLDAESSYDIHVTVSDSNDSSYVTDTLSSMMCVMDALAGGKGISFGKTAELEGVAEFEFDGKFNKPVYGKALGMDKLPRIPANSDINSYLDPGCYAIYSNADAATCANLPIAMAGRLEVWSGTGQGIPATSNAYVRQRYISYHSGNATWERCITRSSSNVWTYESWWKSSLSPAGSQKVYSRSAITIGASADQVPGITGTYISMGLSTTVASTGNQLTTEYGSVRIGSGMSYVKVSGQVLIKCGSSTGSRNIRIRRVYNNASSTMYVSWASLNGVANSNTLYTLTPIIVPVTEGDNIGFVFYTSDSSDKIVSGSATNGFQTYLTVEEL